MTAEIACPFISLLRRASTHVCLIIQQLFINTPHPNSGWINGSDFGPRCVPVYASLLIPSRGSVLFFLTTQDERVLVGELDRRRPLRGKQRDSVRQVTHTGELHVACRHQERRHHVLNMPCADICRPTHTENTHMHTHSTPLFPIWGKNTALTEITRVSTVIFKGSHSSSRCAPGFE